MKTLLAILMTLILSKISAQDIEIKKAWVGADLEYLKIDSQNVNIEVFGIYPEQKRYYLLGDTLRLYNKYTTSRDNFSKQHVKYYDFLITDMTENNLTLIALDSNSLELTGGRKKIVYRERHLVQQPDIEFEMIKFNSTNCYGECPSMTLQITKDKKLMFIGGKYAIKQGFYTATLSDTLFSTLIDILKLSEIDKLKSWTQYVSDAPEFTLEIHYNNQVKYLRNYFLPAVTHELVIFLLNISKKVELLEIKKPFKINFTTK